MQLEIRGLEKAFGRKQVLKDISFSMEEGCYGLLGSNGAGKTTLMRCLCGIYPEGLEHVYWQGKKIVNHSSYLPSLGYLPQSCGLYKNLSVEEHLQLLALYKGVPQAQITQSIETSLALTGLTERAKSRVGSLSGGMSRRLGIAQALLGDPKILLLDEPTAGLDPEERLRFKNMISELKKTRLILISTHIVEDVDAVCDWVIIMKEGKILRELKRNDLRSEADGCVYTVNEEKLDSLREPYVAIRKFEDEEAIKVRVLSPVPQNIQPVQPTIEDAYLMVIDNQEIFRNEARS
ncbi:MAG: ATP-binding cassette domain-containing protein [Eubacteriales bacterium]|nr:ATP-binding cassette domain-containing protein [Eubacteriales bacterium]